MGAIFISYRRGDAEGQARALSIELEELIGKGSVFMDVDSIALGRDFRLILQERLETCDVLLALIGPDWLDAKDSAGNRRLESPSDFVRQEIGAALKRNIPVTPLLVRGAQMPAQDRLPDDLKDLCFRNGFELSHTRWESDVRELVKRLGLTRAGIANDSADTSQAASPQAATTVRSAADIASPQHSASVTTPKTNRSARWAVAAVSGLVVIAGLAFWFHRGNVDAAPSSLDVGTSPPASEPEPPDSAADLAADTPDPKLTVDGQTLTRVAYTNGVDDHVAGYFRQTGPRTWTELAADGVDIKWTFNEIDRDDASVTLLDTSRDMTLKLVLPQQVVLVKDSGAATFHRLYKIADAR